MASLSNRLFGLLVIKRRLLALTQTYVVQCRGSTVDYVLVALGSNLGRIIRVSYRCFVFLVISLRVNVRSIP
jgi:hypothetical protein